MPIDVHAHYVPRRILDALGGGAARYGISVVDAAARCPCLHFDYGLRVRPFFERLLESVIARSIQGRRGDPVAHGKRW